MMTVRGLAGDRRKSVNLCVITGRMGTGNLTKAARNLEETWSEPCRKMPGNRPKLLTIRNVILHSTENPDAAVVPVAATGVVIPQQADSYQHLIELWLHARSRHTQRTYRADAERFLGAVEKPLHQIRLGDLK